MYKWITFFLQNYAREGLDDQRSVNDFATCENAESLSGLRNELMGIASGQPDPKILDNTIGQARKIRFGSHKDWAKLMLLWISSYKG